MVKYTPYEIYLHSGFLISEITHKKLTIENILEKNERANNRYFKLISLPRDDRNKIISQFSQIRVQLEELEQLNKSFSENSIRLTEVNDSISSVFSSLDPLNFSMDAKIIDLQKLMDLIISYFEEYESYIIKNKEKVRHDDYEELDDDLFNMIMDVRNLVSFGYDTLALVLIGKNMEKIYFKLLDKYNPKKIIKARGPPEKTINRNNLSLYLLNIILQKADIISDTIMKENAPIIKYRNFGAHGLYHVSEDEIRQIEKKAINHINNGIINLIELYKINKNTTKSPRKTKTIDISNETAAYWEWVEQEILS